MKTLHLPQRCARRRSLSSLLAMVSLLVALPLAGCGGGAQSMPPIGDGNAPDDAAPVLLAELASEAQGGDERVGQAAVVLTLPGPALQLERPTRVRVHLAGWLHQAAHYGARAHVETALRQPQATMAGMETMLLQPPARAELELDYELWLQLPAGLHKLDAQVRVLAADANDTPTGALARAQAALQWTVTLAD